MYTIVSYNSHKVGDESDEVVSEYHRGVYKVNHHPLHARRKQRGLAFHPELSVTVVNVVSFSLIFCPTSN